jgi:hypothetical protein
MIHSLSLFFNDYNSWQYVVVALGLTAIGGGLTAWKAYFLPFLVLGEFMLFAMLNNQVTVDNLQGVVGGMAGVMPIFFIAGCIIGNFNILANSASFNKRKNKTDGEKPTENPQESPKIADAFDKSQFNKRLK